MSESNVKKVKLTITMHLVIEQPCNIQAEVESIRKMMNDSGIKSEVSYTISKEKTYNGI